MDGWLEFSLLINKTLVCLDKIIAHPEHLLFNHQKLAMMSLLLLETSYIWRVNNY